MTHTPLTETTTPYIRLRLVLAPGLVFGPGKADLLAGIERTGSISAASRAMGMSYRKAWQLMETLNSHFVSPVVETRTGGVRQGGARLTPFGRDLLGRYQQLEARARADADPTLTYLTGQLKSDPPD
ncbi:molybdate transport system regulatory protein [Kushneria sinocarnis]|uniref:Molybdate transport system regulatory protein n=1 Tax=Kushneria sinocarnis TaxID=595502 RepID=A0A420WZY5_9GAMM|nr:LysR family transcriptional regulator [Kushneria sinocarnis]RKR06820.1 molybdate transport system regulatory protein [Kushneria sinocarnis]